MISDPPLPTRPCTYDISNFARFPRLHVAGNNFLRRTSTPGLSRRKSLACGALLASALHVSGCELRYLDRDLRAQVVPSARPAATVPVQVTVEGGGDSDRSEVVRAFRESGRFSRVQVVSSSESLEWASNTMTAHVQVRSEGTLSLLFVAIMTVGVIPGYDTRTYSMTTTITNVEGREKGTVSKQVTEKRWHGWIFLPFGWSPSENKRDFFYDLTAESLQDFSARGAF